MSVVQAIETVDTKGNITRHAARVGGGVRCGRGGTVGINHTTPIIMSRLAAVHCGRCRRLVEGDLGKPRQRHRPQPKRPPIIRL